ncbi:hypothetical protein KFL_010420035 [Klebsormidium nitens]|uniref:Uncharacterized protein n=1 Tax=Klebsormidium nitens TaxID=105231 RepID=A0A1Y1INR0_KLENI|nr:hypothetical protein KFL_010420035 [Klebsormidium nitens]|eukprot:GAQ92535.1 hypothetical protein KFL_010420035 [Klebsormidium nitens]
MKRKSDVTAVKKSVYARLELPSGKKVKGVQTDGAGSHIHVPKGNRKKMKPVSEQGVFLRGGGDTGSENAVEGDGAQEEMTERYPARERRAPAEWYQRI